MNTLNELNFNSLIKIKFGDINKYSFVDYFNNGCKHPSIIGYCTDCEEKGIQICDNKAFCLRNISHGSKSEDFIESIIPKPDINKWNEDGVMFIMESPSKDYGIYEKTEIIKEQQSYAKHPSKQWYWIHEKREIKGYPDNFRGGKYGNFVASAIITFKLKNAYMTNLVKCGLNDSNDNYKGIGYYNEDCINTCTEKYLKKEIEIVKPKVIFTFGTEVYRKVNKLVVQEWGFDIRIVGLPHPAGQRRGFKDEYYNVLYFCMIAKGLYKEKVINEQFYKELMMKFAEE